MSLQDRLASQDASMLLGLGASLSLVYSSHPAGVTNFALFLFGIVAYEMRSSTVPFRQFLVLVLFTGIFDILRLGSISFPSISGLAAFAVMLIKIPVFFTCLVQLRERGDDLRFGQGGFNFQGLSQGAQNWRGNFGPSPSSHQSQSQAPPAAPPGSFPSSGGFRLGSEDDVDTTSGGPPRGPPPAPAPGRNGYASIA